MGRVMYNSDVKVGLNTAKARYEEAISKANINNNSALASELQKCLNMLHSVGDLTLNAVCNLQDSDGNSVKAKSVVSTEHFTRINSDSNGNARYVISWTHFAETYPEAVKLANKIGGRKYNTKRYGGGIVFQSCSLAETVKSINDLLDN
jgi:hypothetical protein